VNTLVRTLNESKRSKRGGGSEQVEMPGIRTKTRRDYATNRLITHLIYLEEGKVEVDIDQLQVSPFLKAYFSHDANQTLPFNV
jgi:hypothetical protein